MDKEMQAQEPSFTSNGTLPLDLKRWAATGRQSFQLYPQPHTRKGE
jgi:hypothetical protein